ncbi:MAG: xanthine dehydrogenase family protein molybdopterin-binding subunit [Dehalococcoidia bacterium]
MTQDSAVGKRITRIDAVGKVTGKALYAADIILPDMLHGKILRSPYAHANIRRIDTSKAQALEGVMAVITVADVPDKKMMSDSPYAMQPLLAFQRVMYEGQPVAAVAARTPYIAEEALKLIEVDYEVLPCVIDVMEAIKPDAPVLHDDDQAGNLPEKSSNLKNVFCYYENNIGDIDAGFREADIILENTYHTQVVHHGQLEPRAAVANVDPQGKITVWSDNQSIFVVRDLVAEFMDVPLTNVNAVNVTVGGAFGAKEPQPVAPICALLSSKTGRPVRIVTTREETFKDSHPTPATVTTVKMGATKEGKIAAVSITMFYDYGCLHGVAGLMDAPQSVFTGPGQYRIPNLHIESYSVFTNKAASGPYRAPTAAQGAFSMESQIDLLARELNMDPIDLRLKNVAQQGDLMLMTASGFGPVGFKETLERMKQYLAEHPKPTGENRGRGIACAYWSPALASASANVVLNLDGSVQLFVGSTDISGAHTSLAQIAAGELGIPVEKVTVGMVDTNTAPYGCVSVGSGVVLNTATAISRACEDLKEQLCQRGADYLGLERADVENIQIDSLFRKEG